MSLTPIERLEQNRLILEDVTSKWTLLVLHALCDGPLRFNAIRRELPMVTQKALTQCLRRLEASGFIDRTIVSTTPVAVVYQVSALGRSLGQHLGALLEWADAHRDEVLAARQTFANEASGNV